MKLFTLAFLTLVSIQLSAQWRIKFDGTNTNNEVKGASFISPTTGFIATQDWIGFTTDSGHTFQQRFVTNANVNFNNYPVNLLFGFYVEDIHAFSADTLLLSGDYGLEPSILYSTNGGSSWTLVFHREIPFNTVNIFNSVWQLNFPGRGSTGYAIHGDQVLKTTNRGQSWQVALLNANKEMFDVSFVSAQTGFAAGPNTLVKTTNGGTNWTNITIPFSIQELFAYSEQFVFVNTSNGDNYYSTNGGSSWIQANTPISQLSVFDMHYINDSTGYAATGAIFQTRNRGKTWEVMPGSYESGNFYGFTKLHFYNNQLAWGCTAAEDLFITSNGGGVSKPKALFEVNTNTVCTNNTVQLLNQSHSGYTYQWFRDNVQFATTYNASYVLGSTGENIKLVVSNGTETDTMVTYVDATASTALTLNSVARFDTACSNGSAVFDIFNSRPDVQYQVGRPCCGFGSPVFGNGGTLTLYAGTNSNEDSTATFTVTAFLNGGCGIQTAAAYHDVTIVQSNPPATALSDTICTQNVFHITITDSRVGYQYWADPSFNKVNGNGGSIQVPCRVEMSAGSFTIDFPEGLLVQHLFKIYARHTARGCGGEWPVEEIYMISRRSKPVFEVLGHEWLTGDNLTFLNKSKQSNTYLWRFPEGGSSATSTQREPTGIHYTEDSTKLIKMIAYTREGCADSATRSIEIFTRNGVVPGENTCPGSNGVIVDSLKDKKYYVTRTVYEDEYGSRVVAGGYTDMRFLNSFYPRGYEGWFAVKYDRNGQVKWSLSQSPGDDYFTFNANSHIIIEQAIGDSLGYTYLYGNAFNRLRVTANGQDSFPIPRTCSFLMRISPAGKILWVKDFHSRQAFMDEVSLDYSGGSLLRGKNDDIYVLTHRKTGLRYFTGNTMLYNFDQGLSGMIFQIDKHGSIIRQKNYPITMNNMRRFNSFFYDSYDSLPKARWGANGKLIVYGELNTTEMTGNAIDGVNVPFNASQIKTALLYFDTTNLQVTAIRPLYMNTPSGLTGIPTETFTTDNAGNYYASYSRLVRFPHSSQSYQFDTLKPRSFIQAYNPAGTLMWTKQAEGLQPKSMEAVGGQLKVAATNYTYTGFTNGHMIFYSNQAPTYHEVRKLTVVGDSSSWTGSGGYGIGSLDLLVASFQPSNGELTRLQHLGSPKEDESMIMTKGYGEQLWMAGTVGSTIRNTNVFIDTTSTIYTYKIAVDNDCNTSYRVLNPFVRLDMVSNSLNCTDSTYKLRWSSSGIANVNLSFSTNNGSSYTSLVNNLPAAGGEYSFNAVLAGATGNVRFKIQEVSGVAIDSLSVQVIVKVLPTVSITSSNTSTCNGGNITFNASSTNGGSTPSYQWYIGSGMVSNNNTPTLSWNFFSNNPVRVEMTSSHACATVPVVTSNIITITIVSQVTPSVTVTGNNVVNQGQFTLITANPNQGGTTPTYQWQDSTLVHSWLDISGATASTINYNPAATGVKLRCIMNSSLACASPASVTSQPVSFIVNTVTAVDPEPASRYGLRLYPNPVTSTFIIDTLKTLDQWESLDIVGMDGKYRYLSKNIKGLQKVEVDVSHLASAVYVAILRRKSGIPIYIRFVKQ